jgi:hypothetical protein
MTYLNCAVEATSAERFSMALLLGAKHECLLRAPASQAQAAARGDDKKA